MPDTVVSQVTIVNRGPILIAFEEDELIVRVGDYRRNTSGWTLVPLDDSPPGVAFKRQGFTHSFGPIRLFPDEAERLQRLLAERPILAAAEKPARLAAHNALRKWRKESRLSLEEAAEAVALSRPSFEAQLYGRRPIGRQTRRIIELLKEKEDLRRALFSRIHGR